MRGVAGRSLAQAFLPKNRRRSVGSARHERWRAEQGRPLKAEERSTPMFGGSVDVNWASTGGLGHQHRACPIQRCRSRRHHQHTLIRMKSTSRLETCRWEDKIDWPCSNADRTGALGRTSPPEHSINLTRVNPLHGRFDRTLASTSRIVDNCERVGDGAGCSAS